MKEVAVRGMASKEAKGLIEQVGRYYRHDRTFDRAYPAIDFLEHAPARRRLLSLEQPLGAGVSPYRFGFAEPVPRKPVLGDFHANRYPVVSSKIKGAIEMLVSECVEFVPAEIEVSGKVYTYWILHHLQHIDALDKERSDFASFSSGNYRYIDKLFLDYEKIAEVPMQQRMVFKLAHSANHYFWHETVKEAVEAVNSEGIAFTFSQGYEQDLVYFPQAK